MPRLLPVHRREDEGGARRLTGPTAAPAPTIMAGGVGPVNGSQYGDDAGDRAVWQPGKPPYRVPTMAEVAAVPWNGLTVASTFSGCGGSCTGYRMAGYRVGWASEFVPSAIACYRANAAAADPFGGAAGFLDERDVRLVQPADVLGRLGIGVGDLDLFDGSPPCQAFSTAGKRHKGWGKEKKYEGGASQRNEDLFAEWLRLLRGLAPKTFVAENVTGLAKGPCKGVFLEILAAMKAAGYRVTCRVLDAQWLGVPQARQRCIFVGVREDLRGPGGAPLWPAHPAPLPWRYSVAEACPWIAEVANESTSAFASESTMDAPIASIVASGQGQRFTAVEWSGRHAQGLRRGLDGPAPTITRAVGDVDLVGASMEGYAVGDEWGRLAPGEKSARYQSLVKADPGAPSPTVTACGGNASTAGVCHPAERRKFSLHELRRLCAFPDDFQLPTTYAKAWACLGNAVPPVMAFWVARTVRDQVFRAGQQPWGGDPACLVAGAEFAG